MNIQWKKVESSNLEAVAYDPASLTLLIRFKSSPIHYVYQNVAATVVSRMLRAESVGSFFAREIKPNYECQKAA